MEEIGLVGENFGSEGMERFRDEDHDSRSISDNIEGDDLEDVPGSKRKKYHRHTPYQIQELENSFKDNPHPDEKARLELGRRLSLEPKQIKFWFQNRRTQMKTQMERHENSILKQENDKLRIENIALKEALRNPICTGCGGQASLGEISIEEQHLRAENARLTDERNRMCMMASKCLGRPVSSLIGSTSLSMSDLELGVGRNGFSGLSSGGSSLLSNGFDFGSGFNSGLSPITPPRTMGSNGFDASTDQSMFIQLAVNAMNELVKLAQVGSPMWLNSSNRSGETLNIEEYRRTFTPCIGMKPTDFSTQGTRASGTVVINSTPLIEILMDSNRSAELFPSIIGRAATIDIISSGIGGTRNGVLQLMQAQFQVLSPLVPVRQVKFLRYCEQQAEDVWAVVDVSVDADRAGGNGGCRRLPSGCIIQDMPNGHSKVIWVEHMEYDESDVHPCFHPLLKSGIGFGAQRWVTNLERQCEFLAFLMSSTSPGRDLSVINRGGRRSIAKLAQRMTQSFCSGICGTSQRWDIVQAGNSEHAKVMIRNSNGNPGEPPGVILSASITVLMPVSHHRIFEFLRSEQTRPQWDVLSHDSAVQQMLEITKGQELGNSISLLRANAANGKSNANESGMLVLQDTSTDKSGSMVVHAAVDVAGMNVVMSGGDSSCVALLPSGFAIFPDFSQESNTRPSSCNGFAVEERGGGTGCLLTVGFQILVSNLPSARLTAESVETVNTLISRTIEAIRSNLHC